MTATPNPRRFLDVLSPELAGMVRTLRSYVLAESPSTDKPACDLCAKLIAASWAKRNAVVTLLPQRNRGAHIRVTWWTGKAQPQGQLLVLGHYDTVYGTGTLKTMPFGVRGGKVFGPGVFDMKAGIVQALYALEALQKTRTSLRKRVVFLWTSDEEIGSASSRRILETEARRSDAVFVLEPAFGPNGLAKTARKGVGEAEIIVQGRASHAGLAPQDGVNAVHELAAQVARIERWNDLKAGVTINADVIEGGTRVNVIAEHARAALDLRALTLADMRWLDRRLHRLKPIHPGARLTVRGGFNRPPLERKYSKELFARAQRLASQMGLTLGECTAGGGSDGNLTAALGIPTLDGLGAVGEGAHSAHEHIVVKTMPVRAALLAALLANS